MTGRPPVSQRLSYAKLIAPLVLVLFAVGWYQFSVVYIQGANEQLVANNNYSVYVPIQQVQGYLSALVIATYFTVGAGAVIFLYNLARFLGSRSAS